MKHPPILRFALLLLLLAVASPLFAETYLVGAKREYKTLGAVVSRLQAGDTVAIDAGTYHETLRLPMRGTAKSPIVLRGTDADYPLFDATGINTDGVGARPRGIFQIEGAHIIVEHLAFQNARNGTNAAGIRLLDSTHCIIRDCRIHDCDMGIFGGDRETALIERCEIFRNGTAGFNGGSHNFYMHGNRVVVRNCYIHDALFGQNYKSRAHYNELWFNLIADSNEGEIGCVDGAGTTDKPNSNTLLVGNTIISRKDRTGNAAKFVLFGSESGAAHKGTLFSFYNTFIAGTDRIHFITMDDAQASLVVQNTLFVGSGNLLNFAKPIASVVFQRNLLPLSSKTPLSAARPDDLPCHYTDGDGVERTLPLDASSLRH